MRDFKCSSCGHEFTVPFGNGICGRQVKCPECGAQALRTHCQNGGGKFRSDAGNGGRAGKGIGVCRRNGNKGNGRRASN